MSNICVFRVSNSLKRRRGKDRALMRSSMVNASSMDSNVWKRLPEDLLDGILARLPIQTLLRFRSVCKRWKTIMTSSTFLKFHSESSSDTPWLLMFQTLDRKLCTAYDIFANRWRFLSFQFPPGRNYEVATVCGGFLCFRCGVSGSLIVCNPITQTCKELPSMHQEYVPDPIAVVLEPDSKSFTVVVTACIDDTHFQTATYSSRTNCWKSASELPLRTELSLLNYPPFCNGFLYFMTSEPAAVLAYNVSQGVWKELTALLPQPLICARLVASQSSLFLLAGLGSNGICRTLSLYQLQRDSMQWNEVQKMPEPICKRLLSLSYHTCDYISCIGHDDYICTFCFPSPEVLVYKISRKTWDWLPPPRFLPRKPIGGFMWYFFAPSLFQPA